MFSWKQIAFETRLPARKWSSYEMPWMMSERPQPQQRWGHSWWQCSNLHKYKSNVQSMYTYIHGVLKGSLAYCLFRNCMDYAVCPMLLGNPSSHYDLFPDTEAPPWWCRKHWHHCSLVGIMNSLQHFSLQIISLLIMIWCWWILWGERQERWSMTIS